MNPTKDLTPCERFVKIVVAASPTPLTLEQIQKAVGYRTLATVRTSVKYLTKARALFEIDGAYSTRRPNAS
jgi:hypothetical protein